MKPEHICESKMMIAAVMEYIGLLHTLFYGTNILGTEISNAQSLCIDLYMEVITGPCLG